MEGGALFDPGFLGGQFLWWVGQIPDDSTWRENINPGVYPQKDGQTGWGRRYKAVSYTHMTLPTILLV